MSAITWIMSRPGHHALIYVDDFVGCEASYLDARMAFDAWLWEVDASYAAFAAPPGGPSETEVGALVRARHALSITRTCCASCTGTAAT